MLKKGDNYMIIPRVNMSLNSYAAMNSRINFGEGGEGYRPKSDVVIIKNKPAETKPNPDKNKDVSPKAKINEKNPVK